MSGIDKQMQMADIAREYDESFDYDLTPRERLTLGALVVIVLLGLALVVWGFAKLYEITRHTEAIEARTAEIVAKSEAECRRIRNAGILWRAYRMGRDGDMIVNGPSVAKGAM